MWLVAFGANHLTMFETTADAAARFAAAIAEGPCFLAGGDHFPEGLRGLLLPSVFSCKMRRSGRRLQMSSVRGACISGGSSSSDVCNDARGSFRIP